jgi:hypothetical protein
MDGCDFYHRKGMVYCSEGDAVHRKAIHQILLVAGVYMVEEVNLVHEEKITYNMIGFP